MPGMFIISKGYLDNNLVLLEKEDGESVVVNTYAVYFNGTIW